MKISLRARIVASALAGTGFLAAFSPQAFARAEDLQTKHKFEIPAQALDTALLAFSDQAKVQVLMWAGSKTDAKSSGAMGELRSLDALNAILANTGLAYKQIDKETVAIVKPDGMDKSAVVGPPLHLAQSSSSSSENTQNSQNQSTASLPASEGKEHESKLEEIIVTGTHIRGAAPSSPVLIISREDIDRSGYTSVGDVIRSLPQNYSGGNSPQLTVGSAPGIDNGASFSGGSSVNLRGLGSGSTLTLVNGHRLADDTVNGAVDISLIPLAAIDRVEVVTDGASAAYGSDAVAGVVNIILKKDYSGSLTSLLGAATTQGGGTEKQFNQLLGETWASGGLLIDYEFDRTDPIFSTERDYTLQAGSPTTLNPGSSRSSVFVSGNQNFGDRVTGFLDALYTYRIQRYSVTYGAGGVSLASELDVHQYSAAFGVDVQLPGDWKFRPVVDLTEQRSVDVGTVTPFEPNPTLTFEGRTSSFEAVADGPLFALPGGVARAAIGGGYRHQTFAYLEQDAPSIVDAERRVDYAFAELAIPLFSPDMGAWIRKLDLNVSGREEHYSDLGRQGVPQIGLAYGPTESVKLRATWGKAYRAPPLFAQYSVQTALLARIPNPTSTTGTSPVLVEGGGNLGLRPETAKTWTVGIDYDSVLFKGLHLGATYFDIAYINRIARIPTYFSALTDPLFAPFVIPSPSAAQQQSVINSAGPNFFNATGAAYDPSQVAALVNNELVNVSRQEINGVDFTANYKLPTYRGLVEIFANATYLDLRQQFVPLAPEVEISGQAFEPSKFRARAGASWNIGPWGATGIFNFTGSEVNPYLPDNPHVASWTTFDLQLNFRPQSPRTLTGFQAALSVQNVFNRDPPFVLFDQFVPGLHYDPANASVLGRFISLRLSKEFK